MTGIASKPTKSVSLVLVLLMTFGALSMLPPVSTADNNDSRTVVLELVTATWCAGCPYADEAADMLAIDFGPERFSVLQYHVSLSDPLSTSETNERGDDYDMGTTGLPAAWFDGTEGVHSVLNPTTDYFYGLYKNEIDDRLSIPSPIKISLSLSESAGNLTVSASFQEVTSTGLDPTITRYALYENSVIHDSKVYNYVVRDIEERPFNKNNLPHNEDVWFQLDGGWDSSKMGVVAFVQVGDNEEIIQSANAVLGPAPTVAITTDIEGEEIDTITTIEGTASGNVDTVEIRIDDQLYQSADGSYSWSFEIDPNQLSDGDHVLQIRAISDSIVYSEPIEVAFSSRSLQPADLWLGLLILVIVLVLVMAAVVVGKRSRGREREE
ncbi:MAG: hypothetical protein JSV43_05490 [Methanobacteriota archaeon]|nr:MAG: hypothetical protein JSV43_05490 [Euryarchaeota archaeon]